MEQTEPVKNEADMQKVLPQKTPRRSPARLVLIIGSLIVALLLGFIFMNKAQAATISGIINFTALKPDPEDKGEVVLKYRKYGTNDSYKIIKDRPELKDTAPWTWMDAKSGQPYEVVADLLIEDKLITSSEPLVVTAPAINQELALRVTWHDLPSDVLKDQQTAIKGSTIVNGIIPVGSQLLIQAQSDNQTTFQTIQTITTPTNENSWSWLNVTPLKDYAMKAVLVDNGNIIGSSDVLLAAGADDEVKFTINSVAGSTEGQQTVTPTQANTKPLPTPQPTITSQVKTGKISGTVIINGPKDKDTSLLVLWRKPGQGNYQVITRINYPAHDGQKWEWDNVAAGQYEITTALQVNNTNTATSRSLIVASPAENVNFTLNTGVSVPNVGAAPKLAACTNNSNNEWDATIQFPNVSVAGNYWMQVGSNPGGTDAYNAKSKPQTNTNLQEIKVRVANDRPYFARYAYSICVNCSSDKNFSNFTDAYQFKCGGDSQPAYKGYICNSSSYTCQATTDDNAPYSYNNTGLNQCQLACKAPTATTKPTVTTAPTSAIPTATTAPIITLPIEDMGPSPR